MVLHILKASNDLMYGIFDIALDSDMPLPELPKIEKADVVIRVQASMDTSIIPETPVWFQHWNTRSGDTSIACAKLKDSYVLRFPGLVDFVISFSNDSVYYFPKQNVQPVTIRHLLVDQVVPRILGQSGRLVLHASAVMLSNGKGIAFLGNSGWGKSTIASSFLEQGAALLTDDCLLIEVKNGQLYAIPNYFGVRLFKDSVDAIFEKQKEYRGVAQYSSKKRLVLQNRNDVLRSKLNALFLLDDPTAEEKSKKILIESVSGAQELMRLVEASFILDPKDTNLIAKQFLQIGKVMDSVENMYQLEYPRDYVFLPGVLDKVHERI